MAGTSRALHHLLPRPSACAPNATLVTLVANESYVAGAVCLRQSLRRVGCLCPLLLVVADPLPPAAMSALSGAFHDSRIVHLSSLRQRVDSFERLQYSSGRRLAALQSTRQLGRAAGWARRTHQKLLLFAIEGYRKAAFLDIDMLIVQNVDALLDQSPFAAVAGLPYTTKSFNSGVFVFEPSLQVAAALNSLSLRATFGAARVPKGLEISGRAASRASPTASPVRIRGAGERFELSDQSILNHHFKGTWRPLPYGYNLGVKTRMANKKLWRTIDVAVVHFVHRPKPWEATLAVEGSPMSLLVRKMGIEALTNAWRYHCLGAPRGNRTLSTQDEALYAAQPQG